MKHLLLIYLLYIFALPARCQTMPVDKTTGLISYTEVIKVDSATQKQLFRVAKMWVLNVYGAGKYATQWMVNDADGTIMLRSHVTTTYGFVNYTLTLECKDGRYKYAFTNFVQQCTEADMCPGCGGLENENCDCLCLNMLANVKKVWAAYKTQTNENMLALTADLKKYVAANIYLPTTAW